MGRAVDQRDLQVDQRIAGPAAGLGLLAQARLDRRQELGGDHAPLELVDEVEHRRPLGLGLRLEVDRDLGVEPGAAGLADAAPLDPLDGPLDRLAIADPRPADVHLQRSRGSSGS